MSKLAVFDFDGIHTAEVLNKLRSLPKAGARCGGVRRVSLPQSGRRNGRWCDCRRRLPANGSWRQYGSSEAHRASCFLPEARPCERSRLSDRLFDAIIDASSDNRR
jgi:hypothetical protein